MTCSYIYRLVNQPTSKKILSVAEDNSYRDPYLVHVQRIRNCVLIRSKWDIYLTLPLCEDKRSLKNNEVLNGKRQRQWMTTTKWHFPNTKGQLHILIHSSWNSMQKTCISWCQTKSWHGLGRRSRSPTPSKRDIGNWRLLGGGDLFFFMGVVLSR